MLKYLEHLNDCWTVRTSVFHNDPEGDLVYDSGEGTTVERTDEGLRIKVRIPKSLNWRQLADVLSCEVSVMAKWAHSLRRKRVEFADMEVLERDPEALKEWSEQEYFEDKFLYRYFYDEENWVIYENSDEYLFLFDQTFDNNYLLAKGMGGLAFTPKDCMGGVYCWLMRWYDRVNGYEDEEEV